MRVTLLPTLLCSLLLVLAGPVVLLALMVFLLLSPSEANVSGLQILPQE